MMAGLLLLLVLLITTRNLSSLLSTFLTRNCFASTKIRQKLNFTKKTAFLSDFSTIALLDKKMAFKHLIQIQIIPPKNPTQPLSFFSSNATSINLILISVSYVLFLSLTFFSLSFLFSSSGNRPQVLFPPTLSLCCRESQVFFFGTITDHHCGDSSLPQPTRYSSLNDFFLLPRCFAKTICQECFPVLYPSVSYLCDCSAWKYVSIVFLLKTTPDSSLRRRRESFPCFYSSNLVSPDIYSQASSLEKTPIQ